MRGSVAARGESGPGVAGVVHMQPGGGLPAVADARAALEQDEAARALLAANRPPLRKLFTLYATVSVPVAGGAAAARAAAAVGTGRERLLDARAAVALAADFGLVGVVADMATVQAAFAAVASGSQATAAFKAADSLQTPGGVTRTPLPRAASRQSVASSTAGTARGGGGGGGRFVDALGFAGLELVLWLLALGSRYTAARAAARAGGAAGAPAPASGALRLAALLERMEASGGRARAVARTRAAPIQHRFVWHLPARAGEGAHAGRTTTAVARRMSSPTPAPDSRSAGGDDSASWRSAGDAGMSEGPVEDEAGWAGEGGGSMGHAAAGSLRGVQLEPEARPTCQPGRIGPGEAEAAPPAPWQGRGHRFISDDLTVDSLL
jgi:hypothetical protein